VIQAPSIKQGPKHRHIVGPHIEKEKSDRSNVGDFTDSETV